MRPNVKMLRNLAHLLSFGFGSGLAPKAPGTFGTLAAVPLYWLCSDLALAPYLALVMAAAFLGVWLCDYTAEALGEHDHPAIVWDEVVGYFITMTAAPSGWQWLLLGFVLFRLFDILKPWPIRWIDRHVHDGLGIMLDDILAGALAWLVLQGVALLASA
ncbi:phosphatidylglycerophosphatase A [Sulfurivermis fontis]|uniref:phosphatidylglycerophosphatase A family protein n=1 Tax=Sulfurivermis fontis TaxID=1972068 RepID=UPI000FD810DB|nr:phosphatidylglycerophosphatase A [Sulfurivermis fontis]